MLKAYVEPIDYKVPGSVRCRSKELKLSKVLSTAERLRKWRELHSQTQAKC